MHIIRKNCSLVIQFLVFLRMFHVHFYSVLQIYLDNMKPSQKELDTVAVVLALQKSKENKEKLRKMLPNKVSNKNPK